MTNMELGISTLLWYDEDDLVPHLPLLAAAGIRHIEIRRLPHHLDYTSKDGAVRLATALEEHGVAVHSLHVPDQLIAAMSGLDQDVRRTALAEVKRIAVALTKVGGRILVTHAGGVLKDEAERPLQFAAGQESLAELASFCRGIGLPVAVENSLPTKPRVGDTVAEVVRFVEDINAGNVGYCLDTSHAHLGEGEVRALELVGPKLMTLHISDNDRQSDQHALPFDGTIDWTAFMSRLKATGYEGVFMLEVRATQQPRLMLPRAKERFERLMRMYHAD